MYLKHMTYTRTNIYLTTPQKKALEREAEKLGLSFSEFVRRILDAHVKESKSNHG
jgi:hypothetical protein